MPESKRVVFGKDFEGKLIREDVDGTHFRACDFSRADLSNIALMGVTFEFCNFSRASFKDAALFDCQFLHCTATVVTFEDAYFEDVAIEYAIFTKASFRDTSGIGRLSGFFHKTKWSGISVGIDTSEVHNLNAGDIK